MGACPRCLVLLMLLLPGWAAAGDASANAPEGRELVVGTRVVPPFVLKDDDGELSGVSIDLWRLMTASAGIRYRFEERDLSELIDGLTDGSLDASVAALTITAEREARVDFTHPFHTTGLAIAVAAGHSPLRSMASGLASWQFLIVVASLGGLLLLVGGLLWFVERRKNAAMFGGSTLEGLGSGFWWAAVTMTTVGYGDKAPTTLPGRIIGLVWMFAAIILISGFTAAIATSLTVSGLKSLVEGPGDLAGVRVVTVGGSSSAGYLKQHGIGFAAAADLDAAFGKLVSGEVDALVYDKPILEYVSLNEYPDRVTVLPPTFQRQDYAIALAEGSGLRETLNRHMLEIITTEQWQKSLDRYLGQALR